MNTIVFVILRRMRAPLLVLIGAYAVATLGMALIPGPQGRPLDFFHAFYFVSYTATTIGFGEIPHPFSPAQRLWTTFSLYLTVIAWIYAIGRLITLAQDPALRRTLAEGRFARTVRGLREPFFIVGGYGDTGKMLVSFLASRRMRCVVIDSDPRRLDDLQLADHPIYVPGLCADISHPDTMKRAGLEHPDCRGIIALTDRDDVNLHMAITAKLLRPKLPVICRSETREAAANMASFGTDHIIDPFDTFADHLFTALHTPCLFLLKTWLMGIERPDRPKTPPHGLWILCGYGRFGKALYKRFKYEGLPVIVVEATPEKTGWPEDREHLVRGWGTDAVTLRAARIKEAVGIVAGTNHDVNNLSILITARELNPELFVVARQNVPANHPLFAAIKADMIMQTSRILSEHIRLLLTTPCLATFFHLARQQREAWAGKLITQLTEILGKDLPEVWEVTLDPGATPAAAEALQQGWRIHLGDLLRDPRDREHRLPVFPLLLDRQGKRELLPSPDTLLEPADHLLLCGRPGSASRMAWCLQNPIALRYILEGRVPPQNFIWRWLSPSD